MAFGLWCGRGHGRRGNGCGAVADCRVVPHHRREAHEADRPDRGGGHRGGVRYPVADCGCFFCGPPVSLRRFAVAVDAVTRSRSEQCLLVACTGGAWRLCGAGRRDGLRHCCARCDHLAFLAAFWRARRGSRLRFQRRRASASMVARLSPPLCEPRDAAQGVDASAARSVARLQTLMQILYLIPPALLLWVTFHDRNGSFVVLIPVVVMAAGQFAGGLAWLSISGEDAPDLVTTAPITSQRIL